MFIMAIVMARSGVCMVGWRYVRRASKNRRKRQNEDEGRPNLRDYDSGELETCLFRAPDLGILHKTVGDVRRRSFIWDIPV